jgi:hypothetical protein
MPVSLVKMYDHFQKVDPEKSQIEGQRKKAATLTDSLKTSHARRRRIVRRKEQESESLEKNGLGKQQDMRN